MNEGVKFDMVSEKSLVETVVDVEESLREHTPDYNDDLFTNLVINNADKTSIHGYLYSLKDVARIKEDEQFIDYLLMREYVYDSFERACNLVSDQASKIRYNYNGGEI